MFSSDDADLRQTLPTDPLPDGAPAPEPDAPAGFGERFRVLRKLGTGAMGDVYLAEDTKLQRRVAIKRIRGAHPDRHVLLQRIKRECLLHARIGAHPHIVTLYDLLDWNDQLLIVMEYVAGESLETKLAMHREAGTRLPPDACVAIALQCLDALTHTHRHGIIHRDIKPANVILDSQGDGRIRAKLMDFGIARLDDDDPEATVITQPGARSPGTPLYMAPEQIDSQTYGPITPAVDIYAVGVMLYDLLAGRPPFGGTATDIFNGHLNFSPKPFALASGDAVDPGLWAVIQTAMAKKPAERYPSAEAFAAFLRPFLRVDAGASYVPELTIVNPPAPMPDPGLLRKRIRKRFALVLGMTLIAGVGGILPWLVGSGNGGSAESAGARGGIVTESEQMAAGTPPTDSVNDAPADARREAAPAPAEARRESNPGSAANQVPGLPASKAPHNDPIPGPPPDRRAEESHVFLPPTSDAEAGEGARGTAVTTPQSPAAKKPFNHAVMSPAPNGATASVSDPAPTVGATTGPAPSTTTSRESTPPPTPETSATHLATRTPAPADENRGFPAEKTAKTPPSRSANEQATDDASLPGELPSTTQSAAAGNLTSPHEPEIVPTTSDPPLRGGKIEATEASPTILAARPAKTHIVEGGETLQEIANHYKLTQEDLVRWNRLHDPDTLHVGQVIYLYERPGLEPLEEAPTPSRKPTTPEAEKTAADDAPEDGAKEQSAGEKFVEDVKELPAAFKRGFKNIRRKLSGKGD